METGQNLPVPVLKREKGQRLGFDWENGGKWIFGKGLLGYFGQGNGFEALAAIDSGRGIDQEGAF